MDRVALEIGPINIYWYSITIFLAIIIGSSLYFKITKKHSINNEFITDLLFYGIIFGIIGARIYYVLFNLNYYLSNPLEIVAIWNGGLAIHGGILAGALWFIYYSKKHKKDYLKLMDLAVPSLLIAQAIGRWGNFFNGEAHGPVVARTTLENMHLPKFVIDGMQIEGLYYKPTFFYESLWCFLGFILIMILFKKYKYKIKRGISTGLYFMWYSLCRFFIESLRTDSLMIGSLKIAQLVSVLLFILGVYLIFGKKKGLKIWKKNMMLR